MRFFAATVIVIGATVAAHAAAFENLDFESATLPVIPQGQVGFEVPVADGLPGWSVYVGTNSVSWVLHNNVSGGPAAVSVFGPDWPYGAGARRIDGDFTAFLAGSFDPELSLSISQGGLVPSDTHCLMFKGSASSAPPVPPDIFTVSLGGESVPISVLATYPTYLLYGGEVSTFAGREVELGFTVPGGHAGNLRLDSIVFSPVPEPSSVALLVLGLFGLACWRRLHSKPPRE